MKQLVHGGDWMGYRERFGRDALDFSALGEFSIQMLYR